MPLELCRYGIIEANEEMSLSDGEDEWGYVAAYRWLAQRIGHWPLFLAVGSKEDAVRITGYQNQWARLLSSSAQGNQYREPGQFPSTVLFSFAKLPDVSYSDYYNWHTPLNDPRVDRPEVDRQVLAPGRSEDNWLRKASRQPGSVQGHVPRLDLRTAERVCCRSQEARQQLIALGFDPNRVITERLSVDR